jgi:hypothetical protein
MEFISNIFSSLLGGANPKVRTHVYSREELENKKIKARSALYATKGGVSGEEVKSVSTSGRSTLFGN